MTSYFVDGLGTTGPSVRGWVIIRSWNTLYTCKVFRCCCMSILYVTIIATLRMSGVLGAFSNASFLEQHAQSIPIWSKVHCKCSSALIDRVGSVLLNLGRLLLLGHVFYFTEMSWVLPPSDAPVHTCIPFKGAAMLAEG